MANNHGFEKVVRIGTTKLPWGKKYHSVYCRIQYSHDGVLSITGVEGPLPSGNSLGGCGQINNHLEERIFNFAPGWDKHVLAEFLAVWNAWHLNHMRPGTPKQLAMLQEAASHDLSATKDYDWSCDVLERNGLLVDNGYRYGTAWLKVEVPASVVFFLRSLPDADKTPAWV